MTLYNIVLVLTYTSLEWRQLAPPIDPPPELLVKGFLAGANEAKTGRERVKAQDVRPQTETKTKTTNLRSF